MPNCTGMDDKVMLEDALLEEWILKLETQDFQKSDMRIIGLVFIGGYLLKQLGSHIHDGWIIKSCGIRLSRKVSSSLVCFKPAIRTSQLLLSQDSSANVQYAHIWVRLKMGNIMEYTNVWWFMVVLTRKIMRFWASPLFKQTETSTNCPWSSGDKARLASVQS